MIAKKWLIIIFVIVTFFNEAIKPNLGRLIKNSAKETSPVIPLPGIITVNILQLLTLWKPQLYLCF